MSAQPYSIPLSEIAAGGGLQSTGGSYSVGGTIGQSDAGGLLTHGQYSVTGGFWPASQLLQTHDAPLLAAELLAGGTVRVFGARSDVVNLLEHAPALALPPDNPFWSQVASPYQSNATHYSITVSPAGHQLFRLRRP